MSEISPTLDGNPDVHDSSSPLPRGDLLPGRSEPGSVKVLVADDDPVTVASLTGLLSEWGYDPVAVRNGSEALNLLSASNGPSLAVLDWVLPDIYGTEVCRRLRAVQSLRYIYLILLTGRDESNDVVEGLGAG